MSERQLPHKQIGEFLKHRREAIHESLAEVSGAVEIDLDMLHKIETGRLMPSEDILLLLLSHLNVEEADARRLLNIAGYDANQQPAEETLKQMFMVIPFDNRVIYADEVGLRSKKGGVVVEFMQDGGNGTNMPISKIGMTKQQALELADMIRITIERSERPVQPKQLPMPVSRKRSKK